VYRGKVVSLENLYTVLVNYDSEQYIVTIKKLKESVTIYIYPHRRTDMPIYIRIIKNRVVEFDEGEN
jgi:hypothetical protein